MSITTRRNSVSQITRNSIRMAVAYTILLAPVLLINACGSKGNSPAPLPVSVQVTPGTPSVIVGGSVPFAASVTNSSNAAVTWSIQEGATGGTITAGGVYTAPMKAGSYHVVATSVADATAKATAAVAVTAPAPAITSTAPASANEGDVYSYVPAATDPVNTAITFSLVSGPNGASISNGTLTWTPTHAQSRVSNSFDIKATTGAGGSADQTFTVTPTGTIQGTAVDTYVTSTGNVTSPEDLTTAYIGAEVLNGSTWTTIQGTGNSDGTFIISGVPNGSYWLAVASGGYWTSASNIDLGQDYLGRNSGKLPSNATMLAVNLDGLDAWTAGDSLDIFNPNLSQDFDWSGNIDNNDTSVVALWAWTGPLSDAAQGDAWYATQMLSKTVGTTTWKYMAKSTPALAITQADGSTTELDGTLSDATLSTVHLKTMGSQFAALAPAINANAAIHSTVVGIYSQPFTSAKGSIGDAETLLEIDGQDPITSDVDFGDITFGNPFPSTWTPFLSLSYEFLVPMTAAGASSSVSVPTEIMVSTTQFPTAASPVVPVITPVQSVKLNGSALTQKLNTLTLSPVLSWDAPATGTPTGYRVTVYQLTKAGSASNYQILLDLFTNGKSMTIPAGVLDAGNEYFFAIRSYLTPAIDFTSAPYHAVFPWADTDMLTPVVSTTGATQSAISPARSGMQHVVRSAMDHAAPRAGNAKSQAAKNVNRPTLKPILQ